MNILQLVGAFLLSAMLLSVGFIIVAVTAKLLSEVYRRVWYG